MSPAKAPSERRSTVSWVTWGQRQVEGLDRVGAEELGVHDHGAVGGLGVDRGSARLGLVDVDEGDVADVGRSVEGQDDLPALPVIADPVDEPIVVVVVEVVGDDEEVLQRCVVGTDLTGLTGPALARAAEVDVRRAEADVRRRVAAVEGQAGVRPRVMVVDAADVKAVEGPLLVDDRPRGQLVARTVRLEVQHRLPDHPHVVEQHRGVVDRVDRVHDADPQVEHAVGGEAMGKGVVAGLGGERRVRRRQLGPPCRRWRRAHPAPRTRSR